jgi:zinc D-Ala-D-Ala dipeptidase
MRLLLSGLLFIVPIVGFTTSLSPQILQQSQQLLLVLAPDWNTFHAKMQRYQRNLVTHTWAPVGKPIPVVTGKNGLAWGVPFQKSFSSDLQKKEGDLRTPAGIFKLGPAFGFKTKPNPKMKMDYLPLKETSLCVDDKNSIYYNQVIDTAKISRPDWRLGTGEIMHNIPLYEEGSLIQYNTLPPMKGHGSCIFMHRWRSPNSGTAGCIAMDKSNLTQVLHWINPTKNPVIAILPQARSQAIHFNP